jgi:hypothetical protein
VTMVFQAESEMGTKSESEGVGVDLGHLDSSSAITFSNSQCPNFLAHRYVALGKRCVGTWKGDSQ